MTSHALGRATRPLYDSLIIATGSARSYFGHDEFAVHARGLKSIYDALEVRGRIFGAFEMAENGPDPRRHAAWLMFALIGAGPTGVEMAGQIAELSRQSVHCSYRQIDPAQARILLFDAPRGSCPRSTSARPPAWPGTCAASASRYTPAPRSLVRTPTDSRSRAPTAPASAWRRGPMCGRQGPGVAAGPTAPVKRVWPPTDLWLLGIVLAIINFWLFAQTLLNVIVFGGLADRVVRPADTGVPRGDPGHDPLLGELLLQRLGPKKPMLLGAGTTAVGILLTSMLSC